MKHILFLSFAVFSFTIQQAQQLQLRSSASVNQTYEITKTAFCSDGSDRASNGTPRFDGPMEARGITYKYYQYVSYYEQDGSVVIARKNLKSTDPWEKTTVPNYFMKLDDRHRKISIGISRGDGVIHLAFDHHNEGVFNYARTDVDVANNPAATIWDSSVFTYVPNLNLTVSPGDVTYPSFYSIDGTGDMILYWRSGGATKGEMNLANYSSTSHTWSFIGRATSQDGHFNGMFGTRGPYEAGINSDADGNIHIAWLWREESKLHGGIKYKYGNHGLFYAQSHDGGFSWLKNNGDQIADTRLGETVSIDNIGGTVREIPIGLEASNTRIFSSVDPFTGYLHVISSHYVMNTTTTKAHHYIRDDKGNWTTIVTPLALGGGVAKFTDDYLFVLSGTTIYVLQRDENFLNWKKINIDYNFPSGESSWDISRINEGIISLLIQHNPSSIGMPSPVQVFEVQIADASPTAIDNVANNHFKLYPNPSNSVFNIELGKSDGTQISIYNISGNLVYKKHEVSEKLVISKQELPGNGVYLIQIQKDGEIIHTQKLIVI